MAISTNLEYASVEDLCLDPLNPRLGRSNTGRHVSQGSVLDLMEDWTLEELAVSYLESEGFWTHEALLVVEEELYGQSCLIVVEGNRRLAALKYLKRAYDGEGAPRKWTDIANSGDPPANLFTRVPYFRVGSRDDVSSFLGFRHVTGIKQWNPAEKAEYIAKLVDEKGLGYREVMRKIGSKTPAVRRNYISYRLLLQMEENLDDIDLEYVEDRFSVMYLTLRTKGAQTYLQIDIKADPDAAKTPVPETHLKNLGNFALWLFGNEKNPPLFTDSRQVDNFGKILQNTEAVEYLERSDKPRFDVAFQLAGADEDEIVDLIRPYTE